MQGLWLPGNGKVMSAVGRGVCGRRTCQGRREKGGGAEIIREEGTVDQTKAPRVKNFLGKKTKRKCLLGTLEGSRKNTFQTANPDLGSECSLAGRTPTLS